jgi:DNA-binding MarR family transcriptional regulator/N-acetylglutamate synthase-like GNAT family acetyltransferase
LGTDGTASLETAPPPERVAEVRAFNRFYTTVIGVLGEGLLETPFSLTEARVIFELAQRDATAVTDLRAHLDIDAGYLSRILSRFEAAGLVLRERSPDDGRRQIIRLSSTGGDAFRTLDSRSAEKFHDLLAPLPERDQRRLLDAMGTIRQLLEHPGAKPSTVLRPLRNGDYGWVVHRHGVLYAEEYGWDETFEALVARIVADHVDHRDPEREAAWIAELDGEPVGCVFCVKREDKVAQLRLLLVEPEGRGHGIGTRLVDECLRFARQAGYEEIILWTNDVLDAARRIYERAGFELREEEPHHSFGHDLVAQTWWRSLKSPATSGASGCQV